MDAQGDGSGETRAGDDTGSAAVSTAAEAGADQEIGERQASPFEAATAPPCISRLARSRQVALPHQQRWLRGQLQAHGGWVRRMGPAQELEGHRGCVNTLQWNRGGSLLASGSDDQCVILWSFDGLGKARNKACFRTPHDGNIFGASFVHADESQLVTTCEDGRVLLLDLARPDATPRVLTSKLHSTYVCKPLLENPSVVLVSGGNRLWQMDLRTGQEHRAGHDEIRIMNTLRRNVPLTGFDVDPFNPAIIAVADFCCVKLFDLRQLRAEEKPDVHNTPCLQSWIPGSIYRQHPSITRLGYGGASDVVFCKNNPVRKAWRCPCRLIGSVHLPSLLDRHLNRPSRSWRWATRAACCLTTGWVTCSR